MDFQEIIAGTVGQGEHSDLRRARQSRADELRPLLDRRPDRKVAGYRGEGAFTSILSNIRRAGVSRFRRLQELLRYILRMASSITWLQFSTSASAVHERLQVSRLAGSPASMSAVAGVDSAL